MSENSKWILGHTVSYTYDHLSIPGGGYVTGFRYSKEGRLACRTDIGGVYYYDAEEERWKSLCDHVTTEHLEETFPIAIAWDDHHPDRIYAACGIWEDKEGVLVAYDLSKDGYTVSKKKIPVAVHGNLNGRGTGNRLLVDPENEGKIYFASQQGGLLISTDGGGTWAAKTVCGEEYLTFVCRVEAGVLVVGTAGYKTKITPSLRNHSLYISFDDGETFYPMPQPDAERRIDSRMDGDVAQRYALDGDNLYVTFSRTGTNSYAIPMGYSCDGGAVIEGHVAKYDLKQIFKWHNDTAGSGDGQKPPVPGSAFTDITPERAKDFGYAGVATTPGMPGLLIVSTISREKQEGDKIFLSMDAGETWKTVLYGLDIGGISFNAPYMKPKYNGGDSVIHWMTDLKIDPADPRIAWLNTGVGVFRTKNLLGEICGWEDCCNGIEETVHLNCYAPTSGEVQCIDIVGDLGGFAFKALDAPCENSFADEDGNRYITCINADFTDADPQTVIVTARGNWRGKTKGGLIVSEDQGESWKRLPMPFGLSPYLDGKLKLIETPNVNSGWVALGADKKTILWSVADGIRLKSEGVIRSADGGKTFEQVQICFKEDIPTLFKVFSDRVDKDRFYAFGSDSRLFVSVDRGRVFEEIERPQGFPNVECGLIDTADPTAIRGEAGKSGVFYIAFGKQGLWKMEFAGHEKVASLTDPVRVQARRLSKEGDAVYKMGLGIGPGADDYAGSEKMIYFNGTIDGVYGFYRYSEADGKIERINNDMQCFGEINSIDGDCRVFGRFYVATGSRGLLYGEPV